MQEASRHGTVEYWELNWKCYGYCHLPTHTSNPAWAKWPQRNTQCTNKYKKKIQHMLFERNYFAIQQFSSRVYVQQCIDEERQGGAEWGRVRVLADEWEWMMVIVSWPGGQLWGSFTAIDSLPSCQLQLISRRYWSVMCSASLFCQTNPCDSCWALFALHAEVWLLFFVPNHSIAPVFVVHSDYTCSLLYW